MMATSTYTLWRSGHIPRNTDVASAESLIPREVFLAERLQVFEKPRARPRTSEDSQHAGIGDLEPAP